MADTSPKFGALVVASLAGVVGTKYLVGGALALIDDSVISSVMVADNIGLSLGVGVALCVVAGGFVEATRWARAMGILAFLAVGVVSVPALRAGDLIIVAETAGMAVSVLYLLVRTPIERVEATNVDDSDSASRVGSTLR